jgi:hypothetical protein
MRRAPHSSRIARAELVKFLVVTYGTEGDVRPLAVLCRGLLDAGHEARLLADAATLGSADALGVPITALSGNIRGALGADHTIAGVVAKGGGLNATARALARIANENAESWLRTTIEAGEGCDAILGAGLAAFVGFSAAEYLDVERRLRDDPDHADNCVSVAVSTAQVGPAPAQSRQPPLRECRAVESIPRQDECGARGI